MIRLCLIYWTVLVAVVMQSPAAIAQDASDVDDPSHIINKRFLSVEDGLASHEVFCGVQDNAGFMWFGTRNGLNRYDGKKSLLFTHQGSKLQGNKVVQLAKDNASNIFIAYGSTGFQLTTNGRVDVMNTVTHQVKTLTAAFPSMPFREQDVYWIANDGTDQVNILTAKPFRLWKYSAEKGFTLRYEMKEWGNTDSTSHYRSSGPLCMFAQGNALLKITNQSTQFLVSKDEVIAFRQKDVLRSLPVGFDEQHNLLLTFNTAYDNDHFQVGKLTRGGDIVTAGDWKKNGLNNLHGRYWYQSTGALNGTASAFYIGTDALYLWVQNAFLKIADQTDLPGYKNLFLYQLFPDNLGNLWLCTSLGVMKIKVERNRFTQHFTTRQQKIQPNSQARGIYSNSPDTLIANVWTYSFLRRNGKTQHVYDDEIKYALTRHGQETFVGGYNLFRLDESANRLVRIPGGTGTEIWSMFSLNDSLLLLGRTDGISLYNSRSKTFSAVPSTAPANAKAQFVYRFFKTDRDTVWAVAENGLHIIQAQESQLKVVPRHASFLRELSLLDAYADTDGVFWLATNGAGLYRWDRKTNRLQQFNIASGFPSDVLYRIEQDRFNNLWISSDYGLIRFNKGTFKATTYTTTDGISHNEFNRTSSFRSPHGLLYFGGLDGVNSFDPKDFEKDSAILNVPLQVTDYNQFTGAEDALINKTNDLLNNPVISLAPGDKFFTLEFQLLDFEKNEAHRYAYRIDGVDKDWNYITENSIRISGLPYGNFKLRIKAQDSKGAWSSKELTFQVLVQKPFYLKWWFLVLIALSFLLLVFGIIKWRTRKLATDKARLEQTVSERTGRLKKALSEQESLLVEKDVLMKEIHHRVKNNLQVISGLLELQSRNLGDETAKLALMEGRSRVRSIALIHQNLYQFENLSAVELSKFVKDLCRQVEVLYARQKNVLADIDVPVLYLDIDTAVPLGLILNELLTNSFKYAFDAREEGRIQIRIITVEEGRFQLTYSDNGPGLPAGFDVAKAGTLGVQLINDLSRQISGKVNYDRDTGEYKINFTNRDLRKTSD